MARRQRVPRHKEHRRKRNKNPKLSPFQREQQRARLANQAPVVSTKGGKRDYPVSQRAVMEYLMERREREEEKRRKRREASEREAAANPGAAEEARTATASASSSAELLTEDSRACNVTKRKKEKSKSEALEKAKVKGKGALKNAKKSAAPKVQSLNDEFSATMSKPVMFFQTNSDGAATDSVARSSTEEIIARKKERKHRKKAEARRTRVQEQLREAEEELQNMILSQGKRKRRRGDPADAKDAAFEKKLKQMQKENADQGAAAASLAPKKKLKKTAEKPPPDAATADRRASAAGREGSRAADRKQITFADDSSSSSSPAAAAASSHEAMRFPKDRSGAKRPRDFHELVDVVRFGDRVDAPPVFDAVPRRDAAVSRLASRLERLGLAAGGKATATGSAAGSKMTKEEEMEKLRERVMESYRKNRRVEVEGRKGVDMHHTFPVFS